MKLHTPAMDQYEHNPIRWWETSHATIGEVLSKLSPTDRSRIAAIGITHQRESFAPFDKDGRPLRNGILWLDDHVLDAIERGENHPRTNQPFAQGVTLYRSSELDEALKGADTVIVSVASVGFEQVVKMALPGIVKADALMVTSKGFQEFDNGDVLLLPDSIRRIAADEGYDNLPPIIAVAGPVKANECAAREPTATIFGCKDLDVAIKYARDSHRQLRHRGHRGRDRRGNLRSHEERLRDRPRHR